MDQCSQRKEYPKPHAYLTESDHQEIRVNLDKHKEHHMYLCLAISGFKLIMEGRFRDNVALM